MIVTSYDSVAGLIFLPGDSCVCVSCSPGDIVCNRNYHKAACEYFRRCLCILILIFCQRYSVTAVQNEVTKLYRYAAELLAEAGCSSTREY